MDTRRQRYGSALIFSLSAMFCNMQANAQTVDVSDIKAKKYAFDNYTVQRNPNKITLKIGVLQSLSLYSHLETSSNEYVIFYSKNLPAPNFQKCESLSLKDAFIRLQQKFPAQIAIFNVPDNDLTATQQANCARISLSEARNKLNIKLK